MAPIDAPSLIARKRDGGDLTGDELRALVDGYLAGDVADEQMSAFLMAGVIRGFTEAETIALTECYVQSGDTVDLSHLRGPTVDKHSTGGVGDTTTLVVAPILAAAGRQVAKLSGRGLGHTGGTLDKLESIPGFEVDLPAERFREQVEDVGLAVAAATADLVPADKRIYALRDVTGTVPSPALIAASVMSKKIAGGAGSIVLDVKTGDGAFLRHVDDATALADLCVRIGRAHDRATAALVTDMSQPLGRAIGNALEVREAIRVLRGEQHARLRDCSLALAATGLGLTGDPDPSGTAERVLDSGAALERFQRFVAAQGGDAGIADDPEAVLPSAPVVRTWSPGSGILVGVACRELGEIARRLGAGRSKKDDLVDPAVGLIVGVDVGDAIEADSAVVEIHARTEEAADGASAALEAAFTLGSQAPAAAPLVHARLGFAV